MTSLTASYPWATYLEQMTHGLGAQVAAVRRELADIDIFGDAERNLFTAELGDVVADRRDAVWVVAGVVSLVWVDWLEHHGVDAVIDIGGLRVHAPCEAMTHLAYRRISRADWFAASTPSIGPVV